VRKSKHVHGRLAAACVASFSNLPKTATTAPVAISPRGGGIAAGFIIGAIASLLGVVGGEFLIPTLVLLFGADIKVAGSLSLAVSLPTMLVGFARYSRDDSFAVLSRNRMFLLVMAAGRSSAPSSAAACSDLFPITSFCRRLLRCC
jgi:hypothetical protein